MPILADHLPAGSHLAQLGITISISRLVKEQTGILGLAYVDAGLAKVVVVALNLINARQLSTVHIVGKTAVFRDPAVFHGADQRVGILESSIHTAEVTALLGRQVRVSEGVQVVEFLILFLLAERVQRTGAQIDLVAYLTAGDNVQAVLSIPLSIVLRRNLKTAQNAQRIRLFRINRLGLLDPVQGQLERVGLLIKIHAVQLEILIHYRYLGIIHVHIGRELDNRSNLGQSANTLCQLQQEGPGRSVRLTGTGQHINQIVQLGRDRNLSHIDGEGVGSNHILAGIHNLVDVVAVGSRVADLTVPSKLAVAAGGLIKVEGSLALVIQGNSEGAAYRGGIHCQRNGNIHHLDAGGLITDEGNTVNHTSLFVTQSKYQITGIHQNGLVAIQSHHGQLYGLPIHRVHILTGKVYAGGIGEIHRLGADNLITQHQVNIHRAVGTQRGKHTVLGNGTPACIGYRPGGTLRQVSRVTGGTDTVSNDLLAGAGNHVIVLGIQQRVVKRRGAGSSRNHQPRGGNRTGGTVGRLIDNRQILGTFLTGHIGGGAAAIQIDSLYTAGIQHDLRNLRHATAAGNRLLTAVQHHQYHLTGAGNTHRRTAGTGAVAGYNLTIFNQITEAGNSFCHLTLVEGIVLLHRADNGSTVLQDAKEAAGVHVLILYTVHNQQTGRLTGRHVKAGAVGGNNNVVVLYVMLTLRIAVLILSGLRLRQDCRHTPRGRIVILVVGKHMHVVTSHVRGGDIIHHLLAVGGGRLLDHLGDTGCQHRGLGAEGSHIGVLDGLHIVACQFTQIIRKSIAARLAQIRQIGGFEVTGGLQGGDHLVTGVGVIHSLTHRRAQSHTVKTILQQIIRTGLRVQKLVEIAEENLQQHTGLILDVHQGLHKIESVQVTGDIVGIKAGHTGIGRGHTQIVRGDFRHHLLQSAGHTVVIRKLQQVHQVTGPASHVCVVLAVLVVIGDIHRAEHMTQVHLLPGGKSDNVQILQAADGNHGLADHRRLYIVGVLKHSHVRCKIGVLIAGHDAPGTTVVAVHTGANILDNQRQRILAGHLFGVGGRHLLQQRHIVDKGLEIRDGRGLQHRDFHVGGVGATSALLVGVPAHAGVGRNLGVHVYQVMTQRLYALLRHNNLAAHRAVRARSQAGVLTEGRHFLIEHDGVPDGGAFRVGTARIRTFAGFGTGCRRHRVAGRCLPRFRITVPAAGAGIYRIARHRAGRSRGHSRVAVGLLGCSGRVGKYRYGHCQNDT